VRRDKDCSSSWGVPGVPQHSTALHPIDGSTATAGECRGHVDIPTVILEKVCGTVILWYSPTVKSKYVRCKQFSEQFSDHLPAVYLPSPARHIPPQNVLMSSLYRLPSPSVNSRYHIPLSHQPASALPSSEPGSRIARMRMGGRERERGVIMEGSGGSPID
jgi:hypothetical protein